MTRQELARASELRVSIGRVVVDATLVAEPSARAGFGARLRADIADAANADQTPHVDGDLGRAVWQHVLTRLGRR